MVTLTYLINCIDYGGAEIGMMRLLSELDPDAFDITVVTVIENNPDLVSELPAHVDLVELNLSSKAAVQGLLPLYRIMDDADVLVCSLFHSVAIGSVFGSIARVPQMLAWHHNTTEDIGARKMIYRLAYAVNDWVLADSEATEEMLSKWGIDSNRIKKLPIAGVQIDDHPHVDHKGTESLRVGAVGRLVPQKGYDDLLKCATRLPGFEFHAVGDGPLRESLREQAPDNVTIHGRVSDDELHRLWESFDIYFQPSKHEGLCITAIEAMASGLPVVASNVDGLTESIVDGETGYLVEQGDITKYSSRIKQLATDPELRERFGRTGERRVVQKYSAEALARGFREAVGQ